MILCSLLPVSGGVGGGSCRRRGWSERGHDVFGYGHRRQRERQWVDPIVDRQQRRMATIDVSGSSVSFGLDYWVENTLGFDLILQPTNFQLVNAIYVGESSSPRTTIMYTANGPMQIQDMTSIDAVITVLTAGVPSIKICLEKMLFTQYAHILNALVFLCGC